MDGYDDLCPRCYRKNNKECRICITQDALRAVRDAYQDALPQGKLDPAKDSAFIVEVGCWFRKGGRFEVKEEEE